MTSNVTYKPNESKREEFRRYLEKTGVIDALTKALVLLYESEERPDDSITFIINTLAKQTGNESWDEVKARLAEAQEEIVQLKENIEKLQGEKEAAGEDGTPPPTEEAAEAPPAE